MALRASTLGAPMDAHLQFTDTLLGKELHTGEKLCTYNDIYCEVEMAGTLYLGQEEVSESEEYKSDLFSLKASGLHKIAKKLEVFPCKDLFTMAMSNGMLKRGLLTSPAGTVVVITGSIFQDLYKMPQPDLGIQIGMLLLNRLWGEADTDHVNQHWVPLLGEIILNNRRPDLIEVLAYNLCKKWEVAKSGRSFFMALYIVDACCAYLNFWHPLFLEWPSPSGAPIHVLFSTLYMHRYYQHVVPICDHFYPVVHKDICGVEMPRISKRVREDLRRLGLWWLFEGFTFVRVEGMLTHPWWPALERFARKMEGMDFGGKGPLRHWDPCERVWCHLAALRDREVQQRTPVARRPHSSEDEFERNDEALTRKLLRGLPTGRIDIEPHVVPTTSQGSPFVLPPGSSQNAQTSDVTAPPVTPSQSSTMQEGRPMPGNRIFDQLSGLPTNPGAHLERIFSLDGSRRRPPEDEASSTRPPPKRLTRESSMHGSGDHRGQNA
eukprot:Gb_27316 [translate_table: standard]